MHPDDTPEELGARVLKVEHEWLWQAVKGFADGILLPDAESLSGIKQATRRIRKHGIAVVGSFILGCDQDDLSVFCKTHDLALEADAVQFQVMTPLPGTKFGERVQEERRMIYDNFPADWDKCDFDHIMHKPKYLDVVDLVRGIDYLIDKNFSSRAIAARAWRTLVQTRNITATAFALSFNRDSARLFASQRDLDSRAAYLEGA